MTERLERPRRSALYMPGTNSRALEKARDLPADVLIFDLEDAVSPDAKETARTQIDAALAHGGYGRRERVVRVNCLDTPWGYADLEMVASSGADAVLLPKVESASTVRDVERILHALEAPPSMSVWCMVETPRGVLHAEEIAGAGMRMAALVMGTSDLAKDLHCTHTLDRLPLLHSLSQCVLAARGANLAIFDGVHLDLDDDEGFRAACIQGAQMGFDGKTLIHPKTIAVANEIFAPGEEEVALAHRVIAAHGQALEQGRGLVVLDGKLIENLHVENARRIVALAEAIKAGA